MNEIRAAILAFSVAVAMRKIKVRKGEERSGGPVSGTEENLERRSKTKKKMKLCNMGQDVCVVSGVDKSD